MAFPIRAPGDQDRRPLGVRGTQYVNEDRHPVAQEDGHILLEHDVDRQGAEHGAELAPRREGLYARIESRGKPVLGTAGVGVVRDKDLLCLGHLCSLSITKGDRLPMALERCARLGLAVDPRRTS